MCKYIVERQRVQPDLTRTCRQASQNLEASELYNELADAWQEEHFTEPLEKAPNLHSLCTTMALHHDKAHREEESCWVRLCSHNVLFTV
jgi:hypothetical protein